MVRLLQLLLLIALGAASLLSAGGVGSAAARLHLDVRVQHFDAATEQRLRALGFEIELGVPEFGRWQGWLPAERLAALRRIEGVITVSAPQYASFAAGAALTEGDEALNAADARARFNVDGSGVRIAVLSDGVVGLPQAQRDGEAPKLADARAFGSGSLSRGQEGTVMIEIIHDLAPGAAISFGAVTTDLDFIAAVNHYAQHVDIIVDDVSFAFPGDQRSDVSVNTTNALANPDWPLRLYVTAAGNWAESHWAGAWQAGVDGQQLGLPSPGAVQHFGELGQRAIQSRTALFGNGNGFRVEPEDEIRLALFWDDPEGQSTNDYNLYLLSGVGEILASSETTQGVGAGNHTPREHLTYTHTGAAGEVFAVIQNVNNDARPVRFDLFALNAGGAQPQLQQRTASGSILAQSDAAGALTVGAVNVGQDAIAGYSSRGPTANGARKPELAAVDQVTVSDTTYFGPRFGGSSAAAPHVAGVGALLLAAQPALLAADGGSAILERRQIRELLIETALDLPPDGPDDASGAGLIDAEAALAAAVDGATVVTSNADSGPGSLRAALMSGARRIYFDSRAGGQTITLRTTLPPLAAGTVLDGAGWQLDAAAVEVGIALEADTELWGLTIRGARAVGAQLNGDRAALHRVQLTDNWIGVRIHGVDAAIDQSVISGSAAHGVLIDEDGSASIAASVIEDSAAAGVFIAANAVGARIGPPGAPPPLSLSASRWPPIDPLTTPAMAARSGPSLLVSGAVHIDGLPAAAGTTVKLYLDRRLAASVLVDAESRFQATVTGPGTEIRFAVNGVPVAERLDFPLVETPRTASVTLRAVRPFVRIGADQGGVHQTQANLIRGNQTGIQIEGTSRSQRGERLIWGNLMRGNAVNLDAPLAAPVIDAATWSPAGVNLAGRAEGAAVVHLYAGSDAERRFAAAATVVDGRFAFRYLDVDNAASHFSVIAHSADQHASAESAAQPAGGGGRIVSVTPDRGYLEGGETVSICGEGIATDAEAPRVWFGGRRARVAFWSSECVTVHTPPGAVGPVDLALQLSESRPLIAVDAFAYRDARTVALRTGWNLVTWAGESTRAANAFTTLQEHSFRAYAWNAEQQRWRLYASELPPRLNTLRTLAHDQPLWIYLDGPDADWRQPAPE